MDDNRHTQIEAYLLGRMNATERQQFEQKLTQDDNLATALKAQEAEHEVMEAMVEMDLFRDLKTWRAEAENVVASPQAKEAKVVPLYRRFATLAIAASFLLLVSAAFWLMQNINNPINNDNLAETETPVVTPPVTETPAEEVTPTDEEITTPLIEDTEISTPKEMPTTTPKTETPPTSSPANYLAIAEQHANPLQLGTIRDVQTGGDPLAAALEDLRNNRFKAGIKKLNAIVKADPKNVDAQFYLGLAQYQQKNYAAAIAPLRVVSGDIFYLETEKAQWYLILAYVQTKQLAKAKASLIALVNDAEHSYHQQAVELQKTL